MRVLLVVDSLALGGAERSVVSLATALHTQGHHVAVAASGGGPLASELAAIPIANSILAPEPVKRRVSSTYADNLLTMLIEQDADIVHAHCYASIVAAALALQGTSTPLVITEHTESRWQGPAERGQHRWAQSRARAIIAVSRGIRDALNGGGSGLASAHPTFYIPNAVPQEPATHSLSAAVTALPLSGDGVEGPLIGVIARMEPEKGVDVFLQAFAILLTRHPHARCVLVGDGSLLPLLQWQAHALGLADRAAFPGSCANARAILPRLSLLAVPSLSEGSPLVVLEGMAAGVPIVASAIDGIADQIRHGEEGLLVSPGNPAPLVDAMDYVLSHPAEAARMADAAVKRAQSHFRFDVMVNRVLDVYEGVLHGAIAARVVASHRDARR